LVLVLCGAACAGDVTLEEGYHQLYNLKFAQAHHTFAEWARVHPEDPMGPVSDAAAYLFSEFDRLHILQSEFFTHDQHFITDHKLTPDPALKAKFEAALESARRLANRDPEKENNMFALVLASGLHSDYLALIEKRYAASFQEMKSARVLAEKLLAAHPDRYDAWIAIGVENYMLSVKPAPMRWLLRLAGAETDRSVGLEKLKLTAEKGHYLAPFARLLLAVAALREHDVTRARTILEGLVHEYPENPLYAQELLRLRGPGADPEGVAR
jgi:tetratricopeptide (TPR) repeat protein